MRTIISIFLFLFIHEFVFPQSYSFKHRQVTPITAAYDSTIAISPYSLKLEKELVLIGTGVATNLAGLIISNNITALTETEINALDVNDINSFDRKAIMPYSEVDNGDYLLYGSFLLPLTFLTNDNTTRDWQILGIMWLEVLALQSGLNLMVKGLSQRTRPYVYDPNTPLDKKQTIGARLSFYSGHTSTTAATSFYIAKVFSEYLDDKFTKILIWSGAIIYPALTGYLRRNTGNHFRTDVITGYLIGATIGYFIPDLHLKQNKLNVSMYRNTYEDSFNIRLSYLF